MHAQHLKPAAAIGGDGLALSAQAEASETRVVMPASGAAWVWMERLKRDRITIKLNIEDRLQFVFHSL